MAIDQYVRVQNDGTIVLHEENDGWLLFKYGLEPTQQVVTLEELRRDYPHLLHQTFHQLVQIYCGEQWKLCNTDDNGFCARELATTRSVA